MNFLNWYRPTTQLPHQAALGVQAVVGFEQAAPSANAPAVTRDQYKAACRALGLPCILQIPADDATLAAEANDPIVLGWDHTDEPNAGAPSTIPVSTLQAAHDRVKKVAPNKLLLLNFDGGQKPGWVKNADGTPYSYDVACRCADWIMCDFYVRNRLGPTADIKAEMGAVIDQYKGYADAAGKPFGFWLETCNQNLKEQGWAPNGCGPTAADIQTYFDLAVAKGVQIIGLFEDIVGRNFEGFGGDEPLDILNVLTSNMKRLATPLPTGSGVQSSSGGSPTPTRSLVTVVYNFSDGTSQTVKL